MGCIGLHHDLKIATAGTPLLNHVLLLSLYLDLVHVKVHGCHLRANP